MSGYDYNNSGDAARDGANRMGATLPEADRAGLRIGDSGVLAQMKIQNDREAAGLDPLSGQPKNPIGGGGFVAGTNASNWTLGRKLFALIAIVFLGVWVLDSQFLSPEAKARRQKADFEKVKSVCTPVHEYSPFSAYVPFAKGYEAYEKQDSNKLRELARKLLMKDPQRDHSLLGAELWRRYLNTAPEKLKWFFYTNPGQPEVASSAINWFLEPLAKAGNFQAIADYGVFTLNYYISETSGPNVGYKIWKMGLDKYGPDPTLLRLVKAHESQCQPAYDHWKTKWNR